MISINLIITIIFACLSIVFILLTVFLSIPIKLKINTTGSIYSLNFPGGFLKYTESGTTKGFMLRFLTRKRFIPARDVLVSITGMFIRKNKTGRKQKGNKPEKHSKNRSDFDFLACIKNEKELINRLIKSTIQLAGKILHCIRIDHMTGTFCLKDPYHNGLTFAVLAPLGRKNIIIIPNFENLFFFRTEIYLIPMKVLLTLMIFLLSVPWIKIYNVSILYKKPHETTSQQGSE